MQKLDYSLLNFLISFQSSIFNVSSIKSMASIEIPDSHLLLCCMFRAKA